LLRSGAALSVAGALLACSSAARVQSTPDVRLRALGGDPAGGMAAAVVVEEGALVHTALLYSEDRDGQLQGGNDARAQAGRVLANLELALSGAATSLDNLVRLHIYVANPSVTPAIDSLLAERFGGRNRRPAVTFVETAMPQPGVLVAMDAIAATAWDRPAGEAARIVVSGLSQSTPRASHVAIQPASPFVIVSGRAARGEFEPAVRETMAQLRGDLQTAGLTFDHVVQVKSFLGDMVRARRLQEIVAESFGGDRVPPQVVTEWRQDVVPVEIELIATAPFDGHARPRVEHFEPIAGRFSRVARANAGRPVFLSGLYGAPADPTAQVDDMFAALQRILQQAGSDVRHLVKATYYVSDADADARINAIRPSVFDPKGPPAASKLAVRGTGRPGKGSTFDMIAVTTQP
jgi:enamine deaminase RidA (YjgF/YER057c/UK114 family)